ncbi:MAG: DNA mismatch repair protein MutS [Candidatus Omnitrophica bacterium]|nr:DNA mismatch repair protein MutS [Candidatus Omnitrophota bacterium]
MAKTTEEVPKYTPMMEQYRSIKRTLPRDTILFFRLGDFYEMFFEDALKASEILNITLTGREAGVGRVPMCGIPHHAFQGYVRTLIENNLKVAICEQIGDPKAAKGIVERKITRIISPATYLDDQEPKGRSLEYMVAVAQDKGDCALSYLELSTGEFFVREVDRNRLLGELSLLAPREVILPKELAEDEDFVSFVRDNLKAALTVYEDWVFEYEEALRLLIENFKLGSPKGIAFHERTLAIQASGAVLYYLRDHLHSALGHIRLPHLLDASEFMILDRQTQRSLELVETMSGQKESGTLLSCLDETLTSMGARTLYQWITHPLLSIPDIEKRLASVEELVRNTEMSQTLRGLFKGVKDMERTLSRLNYGVANARDLVNLGIFLSRVPEIQKTLSLAKNKLLKENLADLKPFPEIKDLVSTAIVETPPLGLKDGGMIRTGYSPELDELREISKKGKTWILEFEKKEIERTGIRSLKIKYSQVFGYTIDISKANLHLVPEDYIRRQTLANAERFIVPELKEWDEKISGAQDKIKAMEYDLFNDVREQVLKELMPLQTMARAIGILDALRSLASQAVKRNWVRPTVDDGNILQIKEGRHPVVEAMLSAGQFVENDVSIGGDTQLIVLTGPNMAGKSTYIRQVAHIVLLAQMGSFVPAASARIGLVDRIFTRIGATDDLARGESTFMVEMLETAHILQRATGRSLLILDEVGRGTSTFDGVSIAWAICEYLVSAREKPRTLFATHYHELTQLEEHFPPIKNFNIKVRETKEGIIFLRKVVPGGSDRSYGIHVAKLAGIPERVLQRAHEILAILENESTEATQIIEGKGREKKKEKVSPLQQNLFEIREVRHPLLDEVRALVVENLKPLEALNKIAEWKERLKKEGD